MRKDRTSARAACHNTKHYESQKRCWQHDSKTLIDGEPNPAELGAPFFSARATSMSTKPRPFPHTPTPHQTHTGGWCWYSPAPSWPRAPPGWRVRRLGVLYRTERPSWREGREEAHRTRRVRPERVQQQKVNTTVLRPRAWRVLTKENGLVGRKGCEILGGLHTDATAHPRDTGTGLLETTYKHSNRGDGTCARSPSDSSRSTGTGASAVLSLTHLVEFVHGRVHAQASKQVFRLGAEPERASTFNTHAREPSNARTRRTATSGRVRPPVRVLDRQIGRQRSLPARATAQGKHVCIATGCLSSLQPHPNVQVWVKERVGRATLMVPLKQQDSW